MMHIQEILHIGEKLVSNTIEKWAKGMKRPLYEQIYMSINV